MSSPTHLYHRRAFASHLLASTAALALPALASPLRLEKSRVTVAVGGKQGLAQLPLTIADQLGFFRSEGLTVEVSEAVSAQRALEMQLEGAAEICSGPFNQTILLQARGLPHQAFVLQARAPQLVFGVSMRTMPTYRSLADLVGKRIGVAEQGSASSLLTKVLLARGGLKPEDVVFVELGPNVAVSALRGGFVDALAHTEPVMSTLEQRSEVRIISDTRTLKGTADAFGGPMPSICLHAPLEFVQQHPATCQALANGIVHALKWLQTAGPGDILKAVPEGYLLGDRAIYLAAFTKVREAISPDGLLASEAARNALRVISSLEPGVRPEKIDIERTYTNEFARRAKERYRA